MSATRLVTLDDVPAIAALYSANRDFLAPWEPRGTRSSIPSADSGP